MEHAPAPRLASDRDRERAVDCLRLGAGEGVLTLDEFADRVARVYEARTAGQLEHVVADLPASVSPSRRTRPTRRVVGVLGSARLHGRWRPAQPMTTAVAVLGGCQVDLSDASVDDDVEIRAIAVFGGVEIVVPEGVGAELRGATVIGSKDYKVRDRSVRPGLPVVRVRATAVFGGVTVRTRPFTAGRWAERAEG
jgi:hypothetical protein